MKTFSNLHILLQHTQEAFKAFYDAMLNDVRLSVFFESQEQIESLIKRQQQHFEMSLSLPDTALKEIYIKLGEYHYELRIPYIDFIKATEILEQYFLLHTKDALHSKEIMEEIFAYFKLMKSFTAKGYLNKMLQEDKRDIAAFFDQSERDETYLPKAVVLQKLRWLHELIDAIEEEKRLFDPTESNDFFKCWSKEANFLSVDKQNFFHDLEQRIIINTQNLFYFLKNEGYLEILPLYTSLLSIYKLTLMMNNALTIEYAQKIIDDMKLDSLTGLFRKDIFEEITKKEIALSTRESSYCFSLVFIDMDNFKGINDNFGHYSGDKALEKLGELIMKNIRASDIGFRIGGDEFALLLKNCDNKNAKKVCKKIKADFSSFEFVFNDTTSFSVGLSIGIFEVDHQNSLSFEEIIKKVDENLYSAKRKGKKQICMGH